MRKLTQKLVLSVVTMALVVIALGTSTFAWFTLTNSASVSNFQAQVTSGEGIEVSLGVWDDLNDVAVLTSGTPTWFTVLPSSAISTRLTEMYATSLKLIDLTSTNGVDLVNFDGDPALLGQFVELDLFFRSTAAKTINWSTASMTSVAPKSWTVDVPSFVAANGQSYGTSVSGAATMQVAAWTAARVSIAAGGLYGASANTRVYQAPEVEYTSQSLTGTVFNSHALPSVTYDEAGSGVALLGAPAYQKAKDGSYIAPDVSSVVLPTLSDLASAVSVITLANFDGSYYYGHVKVRVWIEGWDADAFDSIFNTGLIVQLGFTAA